MTPERDSSDRKRAECDNMVLGHHIVFGAYGFWLPNDPRGSWSKFVGSRELYLAGGKATTTNERRSVAHQPHDRTLRLKTKDALQRPAVCFSGVQARAIGRGFARYVDQSGLPVWACSILPNHVHLATGPFRLPVEQIVIQLKGAATRQLIVENLHPFGNVERSGERVPKCWARGEWKVFLRTETDICRSIRYVENNPVKEGKPAQTWPFVTSPRLINCDAESTKRSVTTD